jgi:hypothetical protein
MAASSTDGDGSSRPPPLPLALSAAGFLHRLSSQCDLFVDWILQVEGSERFER